MRSNIACLLVLSALLACGDATPPEHGGAYTATLHTPAGHTNGAAVIELNGSGIEAVTGTATQLFTDRTGDVVRVVIIADTPGTLRFGLQLARGNDLPRATVIEVADDTDTPRPSLAGYAVRFTR